VKRWIVAAVIVVLGVVGGLVYGLVAKPSYQATTTISATEQTPTPSRRDVSFALNLGRLANQQGALQAAATTLNLSLEELNRSVEGTVTPETPIVTITARARTPKQSADIANAVAAALVAAGNAKTTSTGVEFEVLNAAVEPVRPASPNMMLAAGVGAGAAVLVAALYLLATGGTRRPARQPAPPAPLPGTVGERVTNLRPPPGTPAQGLPRQPPPRGGRVFPPPPGPPPGGPPRTPVPPRRDTPGQR